MNWLKQQAQSALNWAKKTASNILNSKPVQSIVKPVVNTVSGVIKGVQSGLSKPYNPNNTVFSGKPSNIWNPPKNNTPSAEQQRQDQVQAQKNQNNQIVNSLKNTWSSAVSAKPSTAWSAPKATIKPTWDVRSLIKPAQNTWKAFENSNAGKFFSKVGNKFSDSLNNSWFGHTIETPFRWKNAWDQKNNDSNHLKTEIDTAVKDMESSTTTRDSRINDILKRRDSGELSDDQARSLIQIEENRIQAKADRYNQYFQDKTNSIKAPIPMGSGTKAVLGGLNWLGNSPIGKVSSWVASHTFGEGDPNFKISKNGFEAPSLGNILSRLLLWARNNAQAGDINPQTKETYGAPRYYSDGRESSKPDRSFVATWKQQFYPSSKWTNTEGDTPENQKLNRNKNVMEVASAPEWYFGGLLGDAAKGLGRLGKWVSNSSTAKTITQHLNDIPGSRNIKKTFAWLNRYTDESPKSWSGIQKNVAKDFDNMTDSQRAAYQYLMNGKDISHFKISDQKVAKHFADKWRGVFNEFHLSENAKGIKTPYRLNYLPSKQDFKAFAVEHPELVPKNSPWFTKSKSINKFRVMNSKDLQFAHTVRIYAHNKAIFKATPASQILSGAKKVIEAPTKLWKKSVLQWRPSWYINNASWNLPASVMAGGLDTFKSYGRIIKNMIKERKLSPSMIENMPDAVHGGLYSQFDKVGKRSFGSKVENFSRAAVYDSLKRKGWSDSKAIKRMNDYMFDYRTKNWEIPLKTVMPFWSWQKNITKLTAKLPFTNPKANQLFRQIRLNFMDKPLQDIPDKIVTFNDPETGNEVTYNPRDGYKGKIKIPGVGWRTVPFLPIMPEQLDNIGLNPWLRFSQEILSGKNQFGQSILGDSNFMTRLAEVFPQAQLWNSFKSRNDQNSEKWISDSGYTKEKQGFDPAKGNYDKNLDMNKKFMSSVKNFALAGWGNQKNFNQKEFYQKQNVNAFSKEYFSHNWDKEFTKDQFNEKQAAKEAVAKKYGLDLNKDVYHGLWRKYDTTDTLKKKDQLENTSTKRNQIYDEYSKIPKGTGQRTKYILDIKKRVASGELLNEFPGLDVFPNINRGDIESASVRSDFWHKFFALPDLTSRMSLLRANPQYMKAETKSKIAFWDKVRSIEDTNQRLVYMKAHPEFLKAETKAKLAFWDKYYSSDKLSQRLMKRDNPNMFKGVKNSDPKKADMAWAYENLAPYERKLYFKQKGYVLPSLTFSDIIKAKAENQAKKERDLIINPWLKASSEKKKEEIIASVKTKVKQGKKYTWSNKPIDKKVWKAT